MQNWNYDYRGNFIEQDLTEFRMDNIGKVEKTVCWEATRSLLRPSMDDGSRRVYDAKNTALRRLKGLRQGWNETLALVLIPTYGKVDLHGSRPTMALYLVKEFQYRANLIREHDVKFFAKFMLDFVRYCILIHPGLTADDIFRFFWEYCEGVVALEEDFLKYLDAVEPKRFQVPLRVTRLLTFGDESIYRRILHIREHDAATVALFGPPPASGFEKQTGFGTLVSGTVYSVYNATFGVSQEVAPTPLSVGATLVLAAFVLAWAVWALLFAYRLVEYFTIRLAKWTGRLFASVTTQLFSLVFWPFIAAYRLARPYPVKVLKPDTDAILPLGSVVPEMSAAGSGIIRPRDPPSSHVCIARKDIVDGVVEYRIIGHASYFTTKQGEVCNHHIVTAYHVATVVASDMEFATNYCWLAPWSDGWVEGKLDPKMSISVLSVASDVICFKVDHSLVSRLHRRPAKLTICSSTSVVSIFVYGEIEPGRMGWGVTEGELVLHERDKRFVHHRTRTWNTCSGSGIYRAAMGGYNLVGVHLGADNRKGVGLNYGVLLGANNFPRLKPLAGTAYVKESDMPDYIQRGLMDAVIIDDAMSFLDRREVADEDRMIGHQTFEDYFIPRQYSDDEDDDDREANAQMRAELKYERRLLAGKYDLGAERGKHSDDSETGVGIKVPAKQDFSSAPPFGGGIMMKSTDVPTPPMVSASAGISVVESKFIPVSAEWLKSMPPPPVLPTDLIVVESLPEPVGVSSVAVKPSPSVPSNPKSKAAPKGPKKTVGPKAPAKGPKKAKAKWVPLPADRLREMLAIAEVKERFKKSRTPLDNSDGPTVQPELNE